MENRNGLLVDFRVAQANGRAEREAALAMLDERLPGTERDHRRRRTRATTRATSSPSCRALNVTPHVAQNERPSAARRSTGERRDMPGYAVSQRIRKRVEEIFGWVKTVGGFRRTRFKGRERTQLAAGLLRRRCLQSASHGEADGRR